MDLGNLKLFYNNQIANDFYPYWKKFEDDLYGGVLNCIDNNGQELISNEKFVWSQGRYLWILSKLSEHLANNTIEGINNSQVRKSAKLLFEFLKEYAIYEEQGVTKCYYLLSRNGIPKKEEHSSEYDASIFADCFVLIGMSQYIRVFKNNDDIDLIEKIFIGIKERIEEQNFKTEPYPIPAGYRSHSIPMILLNTYYEFVISLEENGINISKYKDILIELVDDILNNFFDKGLLREYISLDNTNNNTLLERVINPGHTLEDLWFMIEVVDKYGEINKYIEKISLIAKETLNIGWDKEYGGLLRFVDKEGGYPKGISGGSRFEKLILDTHDMKLWWPHSESLYLLLLLQNHTDDEEFREWYEIFHEYSFRIFPNEKIGEWVQIRERDGKPAEKIVALPVKDPFHILRSFIKIIEL